MSITKRSLGLALVVGHQALTNGFNIVARPESEYLPPGGHPVLTQWPGPYYFVCVDRTDFFVNSEKAPSLYLCNTNDYTSFDSDKKIRLEEMDFGYRRYMKPDGQPWQFYGKNVTTFHLAYPPYGTFEDGTAFLGSNVARLGPYMPDRTSGVRNYVPPFKPISSGLEITGRESQALQITVSGVSKLQSSRTMDSKIQPIAIWTQETVAKLWSEGKKLTGGLSPYSYPRGVFQACRTQEGRIELLLNWNSPDTLTGKICQAVDLQTTFDWLKFKDEDSVQPQSLISFPYVEPIPIVTGKFYGNKMPKPMQVEDILERDIKDD